MKNKYGTFVGEKGIKQVDKGKELQLREPFIRMQKLLFLMKQQML